jgi:hypothetical protein
LIDEENTSTKYPISKKRPSVRTVLSNSYEGELKSSISQLQFFYTSNQISEPDPDPLENQNLEKPTSPEKPFKIRPTKTKKPIQIQS